MKKYFTIHSTIMLSVCIQNVSMCMDSVDERTHSVIWFQDKKMPSCEQYIKIPFITRLAKEEIAFYNSQKTPIFCRFERLPVTWVHQVKFIQYKSVVSSSYNNCLEVKYAQSKNFTDYKSYLEKCKDESHYNDMIMSMAAQLYYVALQKNSQPPYLFNSAINLGFALDKLSCSKDCLQKFIYTIGWFFEENDLEKIAQVWKNFCDRKKVLIAEGKELETTLSDDRLQCSRYIVTLFGLAKKDRATKNKFITLFLLTEEEAQHCLGTNDELDAVRQSLHYPVLDYMLYDFEFSSSF